MHLAPTFEVPSMSRHPKTGDWYPAINKPAGVIHWFKYSKDAINVDWVLILDTDMIIRGPILPWELVAALSPNTDTLCHDSLCVKIFIFWSVEILRLQESLSKYERTEDRSTPQVNLAHLLAARDQELRTISAEMNQMQPERERFTMTIA
ncbi:hypothetical protein KIW84_065017 [Lathyrus oleraceus]|uniref:Uncharacterized protein n=1 Tax=Pisum sativum TaxID=3888 RepID=A0A9D4WDV0_PEA|nr:hypothetical protein KIW84_065017 [Pisum sativum]